MSRFRPRSLSALTLVALLGAGAGAADDGAYSFRDARAFLGQYCTGCHGPEKPKGKLNLARFTTPEQVPADRKVWGEVLKRVRTGEMPPRDSKTVLPPEGARLAFLGWVRQSLRADPNDDTPRPGPAPVRRLNKSQYRATVRDLLGVHFDAAHALPDEGAGGEGFDNAAETLFISPVHAEKYLDAAKEALRYAASDSKARARIFVATPDDKTPADVAARRVLDRFLLRAYRRPVRAGEVDRLMALFRKEHARGQPFDEAVLYALQAVLISPHFLFRVEEPATSADPRPVTDYELATRLSYFLWNTMPDDRLFELAAAGKLRDGAVLKAEVTRMLKDKKVRGLAEDFTGQWLETRRLGVEVKPDRKLFPRYTDELETAMREEPIYVLQEILTDDRSLLDLLDNDFTYADKALAKHYGIPPPPQFGQPERVSLPKGSHRGGVLTMAGVLAVSSYPHRTSPVLRGKWVMEAVLGTPPQPPPPDVPPLPEDKKQAEGKTVRERLLAHRANPVCASCHDRIDPLGFGLENYDAVGAWREKDAGRPVDATGEMPDGTKFSGPDEMKKALLARKDEFLRHLAAKLLGYALGRGLVSDDYRVIDRAVESLKKNDYHSHALVWEIVNSTPFRYRPGAAKVGTGP